MGELMSRGAPWPRCGRVSLIRSEAREAEENRSVTVERACVARLPHLNSESENVRTDIGNRARQAVAFLLEITVVRRLVGVLPVFQQDHRTALRFRWSTRS